MSKINNIKKLQFLLVSLLVFSFLSYKLAISDTFALMSDCDKLESKLKLVDNAPVQIQNLSDELDYINKSIDTNISAETDFQELLLEKVTHFSGKHRIILRELPESHFYNEQDFIVETNKLKIEGGFINLLNLLYKIETELKFGRVSGVSFNSEKDFKNKRLRLNLSIYYQNIKVKK